MTTKTNGKIPCFNNTPERSHTTKRNTNLLGHSECSDQLSIDGDCFDNYFWFTCQKKRKIIGYQVEPRNWYVVSKLDEDPAINIHIKMTLDYLKGTTEVTRHVIDSSDPNMISPSFSVGDTEFYNNGISQTNNDPAKDYIMLHVKDTSYRDYPISTDVAYFVDADPVGTKIKGKIGAIQCRVNERDHCDAPDEICDIDFFTTSSR